MLLQPFWGGLWIVSSSKVGIYIYSIRLFYLTSHLQQVHAQHVFVWNTNLYFLLKESLLFHPPFVSL